MIFSEVYGAVLVELPQIKSRKDVQRAVNRTLLDINNRILNGILTTEQALKEAGYASDLTCTFNAVSKQISDNDGGNFISDYGFAVGQKLWASGTDVLNTTELTITAIGDKAATNDLITVSETIVNDSNILCTLEGFTVTSGYSWDNVNGILTLPDKCKKLIAVFENDIEVGVRRHESVYDTDNASETYLAQINRDEIKFTADIMGAQDDVLKVKMEADITAIAATSDSTVVDVPQQYEKALYDGVFRYLYALPEYKNDDRFKYYNQEYADSLFLSKRAEIYRDIPTDEGLDYQY